MDSITPKRKFRVSLVECLAGVAIVTVLWALILPIGHGISDDTKRKVSQIEMKEVGAALQQYRAAFGIYPLGDNASISKALGGENPKQTTFLDLKRRWVDTNGGLVDFWHTPYIIQTNQTSGLSIRSAGPNRRFGDADDLEQPL